ncbi:MAG: universal stress protein [Pyrinomonadaceae bacterium]|nr:universal stress protein [Pyrinomonadaceae bacterium]
MKILIAYDGSDCANAALADLQCAGLPGEAEVMVLTAVDVFIPPEVGNADEETFTNYVPQGVKLAHERNALRFAEAEALAAQGGENVRAMFPGWNVKTEALADTPHWALIKETEKWKPDLVVVGSHGRSALGRMILGSVSQKILYEAQCSVRIARGRTLIADTPIRLVLGADGSPDSEAMLDAVAARNWREGTQVKLITAAEPFFQYGFDPDEQMSQIRELQNSAVKKLNEVGLEVTPIIKEGDPKHILLREAEAWGADCILLGAKGHRLLERFLIGSVSSAVAARAHCSVEIVRNRIGHSEKAE